MTVTFQLQVDPETLVAVCEPGTVNTEFTNTQLDKMWYLMDSFKLDLEKFSYTRADMYLEQERYLPSDY